MVGISGQRGLAPAQLWPFSVRGFVLRHVQHFSERTATVRRDARMSVSLSAKMRTEPSAEVEIFCGHTGPAISAV